jgi:hypothetical protein
MGENGLNHVEGKNSGARETPKYVLHWYDEWAFSFFVCVIFSDGVMLFYIHALLELDGGILSILCHSGYDS